MQLQKTRQDVPRDTDWDAFASRCAMGAFALLPVENRATRSVPSCLPCDPHCVRDRRRRPCRVLRHQTRHSAVTLPRARGFLDVGLWSGFPSPHQPRPVTECVMGEAGQRPRVLGPTQASDNLLPLSRIQILPLAAYRTIWTTISPTVAPRLT
jgi:hypothetical protein